MELSGKNYTYTYWILLLQLGVSVVRYRLWVGKEVHSSVPTNSVRLSLITELHSSTEYLTFFGAEIDSHWYIPLPFLCDMLQSNLVVLCYVDHMLSQLAGRPEFEYRFVLVDHFAQRWLYDRRAWTGLEKWIK